MILRNLRQDLSTDESKTLQDRQCMYNVTLRRVCTTFVAGEEQ
jgi:hypothetical protein